MVMERIRRRATAAHEGVVTHSAFDTARVCVLVDLYEANVDDLYRYCLARCGDPAMAEDATAETYQAAVRSLVARPETPIDRPWLFVVARRRLVDQFRAAERRRRRVQRAADALIDRSRIDDAGDPSAVADRVMRALDSLPDRQRMALALRYLDDCSVAEVAEELEIEYRAAESLLARGRRSFSKAWFAVQGTEVSS